MNVAMCDWPGCTSKAIVTVEFLTGYWERGRTDTCRDHLAPEKWEALWAETIEKEADAPVPNPT